MQDTINELNGLWATLKAHIERYQRYIPVTGHRCLRGQCHLVNVPIIECRHDPETGLVRHCLGLPLCPKSHTMTDLARSLHLRVCEQTGTAHFCGDLCTRWRIVRGEGDTICDLTGIVIAERRVTTGMFGDFVPSTDRVKPTSMVSELTTNTILDRAVDLTGARLSRAEKNYDSHYAQFMVYVAGVFSRQRFDAEDREMYKQSEEVGREIEKFIVTPPQMFPDVLRMVQIAAIVRRRHARPVRVTLNRERVLQIIPSYTRRIITLFAVLRRYVRGSETLTNTNLRDFALAVLELCETGITVRDRHDMYDIVILSRDSLLSVVPVSQEAHMAVKNAYKSLSGLKTDIVNAFQRAIDSRVDPALLRIDTQCSRVHLFPSDVFH